MTDDIDALFSQQMQADDAALDEQLGRAETLTAALETSTAMLRELALNDVLSPRARRAIGARVMANDRVIHGY